ncbi:MAG: hypothetical protein ACE5DN_06345, partial [Flavobacteriales bacterium]
LKNLLNDPGGKDGWEQVFPQQQNPNTRTHTLTEKKNELREQITDLLRTVYNDIAESALTDDDRDNLNLKKRDTEPTPAPVPSEAPDVEFVRMQDHVMRLRITDPANPHTQAKPEGVDKAQVFIYFGTQPPASENDYRYLGETGRFVDDFPFSSDDVGKTIFIITRWVNTRGEVGPFNSKPIETVII